MPSCEARLAPGWNINHPSPSFWKKDTFCIRKHAWNPVIKSALSVGQKLIFLDYTEAERGGSFRFCGKWVGKGAWWDTFNKHKLSLTLTFWGIILISHLVTHSLRGISLAVFFGLKNQTWKYFLKLHFFKWTKAHLARVAILLAITTLAYNYSLGPHRRCACQWKSQRKINKKENCWLYNVNPLFYHYNQITSLSNRWCPLSQLNRFLASFNTLSQITFTQPLGYPFLIKASNKTDVSLIWKFSKVLFLCQCCYKVYCWFLPACVLVCLQGMVISNFYKCA